LTDKIVKNQDSRMPETHAGGEKGTTNTWPPYCRLDLLVILALSTLSVLLTIGIGDKSYDDTYITYRYARNLALGRGFVYNPGESLLGTTTPLYTLLLASVASPFSQDVIPKLGQWLAGLSILCCAVFTYLLARDDGKRFGGSIAALFVLINPVIIFYWGGETPLLIALILIAFFLYFRGHQIGPGVLLALATLTRGEGILPAMVLCAHYVVVNRKFPWRGAIAFVLILVPWAIYATSVFGSPLPSTLEAKQAQFASGYFAPFLKTTLRWLIAHVYPASYLPVTPSYSYTIIFGFAALGGLSLFRDFRSRWWCVVIWLGLYAGVYSGLRVPFYFWYAAPLVFGGLLLAGLGAQFLLDFRDDTRRAWYKPLAFIIILILLAMPVAIATKTTVDFAKQPIAPVQRLYTNAGLWLRDNTPLAATVGYFEIGFVGYYSDRYIVDAVGLVNRDVSEHVARGDVKWAYLSYKPDYLIINPVRWYDRIGSIRDESWFEQAYREVALIAEPGYLDAPLRIYEKINEAAIPGPNL